MRPSRAECRAVNFFAIAIARVAEALFARCTGTPIGAVIEGEVAMEVLLADTSTCRQRSCVLRTRYLSADLAIYRPVTFLAALTCSQVRKYGVIKLDLSLVTVIASAKWMA
jgi:hypothetical protein